MLTKKRKKIKKRSRKKKIRKETKIRINKGLKPTRNRNK